MAEPKLETKYALNLSTIMHLSVSDVGVLRIRIRMQRREYEQMHNWWVEA